MSYQVNFGDLTVARAATPVPPVKTRTFRLAVLGDFAARAHRGEGATGPELGARPGHRVDVDNVDETMARLDIRLNLPRAGGEITVASLDDLHPDQLYANLPVFGELSGLLGRLKNASTFARAAAEMAGLAGPGGRAADAASPVARDDRAGGRQVERLRRAARRPRSPTGPPWKPARWRSCSGARWRRTSSRPRTRARTRWSRR